MRKAFAFGEIRNNARWGPNHTVRPTVRPIVHRIVLRIVRHQNPVKARKERKARLPRASDPRCPRLLLLARVLPPPRAIRTRRLAPRVAREVMIPRVVWEVTIPKVVTPIRIRTATYKHGLAGLGMYESLSLVGLFKVSLNFVVVCIIVIAKAVQNVCVCVCVCVWSPIQDCCC